MCATMRCLRAMLFSTMLEECANACDMAQRNFVSHSMLPASEQGYAEEK